MDDVVLAGTSIDVLNEMKTFLLVLQLTFSNLNEMKTFINNHFHMKGLGDLRFFLGLEVEETP